MSKGKFVPMGALACAMLLCQPVPAEIYKWTDEDGVTHFSERRPDGTAYEGVDVKRRDADPDAVDRLAEMQEKNKKAREARQKSAEEKAQIAEKKRKRQAQCSAARAHRGRLVTANRLFTVDENGERVRVGEDARTADLERIDEAIDELCS